ncbi:PREDICTED: uncharacterized protein LOC109128639 [Camelina sativa]|uniref:Uncharacterized protein LOC109128639 n=1 Tax=Camelina sativa TaxID=90675 RepID=A0ABM1QW41_CAMSA|nr:PREDICTED: uncharacterized protein LOC109128639 [Camelina sativa]
MAMLSRQFAKFLKRKGEEKKSRMGEEMKTSSKNVQCFECKGYGHVRSECANLQKYKKKAMNVETSDSETDSDEEEELKNFVAFTTFEDSSESVFASASASVSATASEPAVKPTTTSEHESDSDSDAEDMSYEKFVLIKVKLELEAKIVEAEKHATEKGEETLQAKTDKCGLGFEGKVSKSDIMFVSSGKITSASGTALVTETALKNALKSVSETVFLKEHGKRISELENAPRQVFRPVCHHCGVVGHIRPRCFRLLREKSRMENAYDVRFQGPTCYHCGVQGHIKRNCFRFIQEDKYGGLRRNKVWVRKDEFYGGGGENEDVFGDVFRCLN